jgi:uncharacterized membrane protein YccC
VGDLAFLDVMSLAGFDLPRLRFATRVGLAACLALLAAWAIGLEHPQWSAMTVWAASQPMRGQLLEKSLFRVLGTLLGVAAGVAIAALAVDRPALLVAGLALWVAMCAGLGNTQRSFVAYGTMLAGYSAAMVALLDTAHPDRIYAVGFDRLLTILVGVAIAVIVGLLFTPPDSASAMMVRVRAISARVLRDLAARLRGVGDDLAREQAAILSEMAAIEAALDPHGAGSLRSRRSVRAIRILMLEHVSALLWLRGRAQVVPNRPAGEALTAAADALERSVDGDVVAAMTAAVAASDAQPALHAVVGGIEAALRLQLAAGDAAARPQLAPALSLHRDWIGARQAALRALVAMLATGAIWLLTGWSGGAFMLLGTAIMVSLFSTFDNPAATMRTVFLGQLSGVAGALACHWLVWPLATSALMTVLLIMPFVAVGVLVFAHRRTMMGAFDYNMVLLLLLQPVYPLAGSFPHSMAMGAAVLTGPTLGFLAYRLIYPLSAERRMDMLIASMVGEVQAMAAAKPGAGAGDDVWRVRLHHRLLALVRAADKTTARNVSAIDGSLAVLDVGRAVRRLQELLHDPSLRPTTQTAIRAVLRRLRALATAPERAQHALALIATRLAQADIPDPAVTAAVASVAANLDFFRRAAPRRGSSAGPTGRRRLP